MTAPDHAHLAGWGQRGSVAGARCLGGGAMRVTVTGEVDVFTVPVLRAALDQTYMNGAARVELDLSDVGFPDCAGATAIVAARRRASIVLVAASVPVHRVLTVLGVASQLSTAD